MSALTVEQALENIYTSLHNDNDGLDEHIDALKASLGGKRDVTVDATRIPVPNREGRKNMQAYFKRYGVNVNFENKATPIASA